MRFETNQIHFYEMFFGLLSSKNSGTMATWRYPLYSCLKQPHKSQRDYGVYNFEMAVRITDASVSLVCLVQVWKLWSTCGYLCYWPRRRRHREQNKNSNNKNNNKTTLRPCWCTPQKTTIVEIELFSRVKAAICCKQLHIFSCWPLLSKSKVKFQFVFAQSPLSFFNI